MSFRALLLSTVLLASTEASAQAIRVFNTGGASLGLTGCIFTITGIDCVDAATHTFNFQNSGAGVLVLNRDGNLVWDAANDGIGSTLNADFLDDLSSAAFLQVAGGTMTGQLLLKDTVDCTTPNLASAGRTTTGFGVIQSSASLLFCRSGATVAEVGATWSFFQSLSPNASDSRDLGDASLQWDELFLDSGTAADPALTFNGSGTGISGTATEGVASIGTSGAGVESFRWTAATIFQPTVTTGTIPRFKMGAGASTTAPTKATCDVNLIGSMIYIDDTDDAVQADVCVCLKDDATTFSWRSLVHDTLGIADACTY